MELSRPRGVAGRWRGARMRTQETMGQEGDGRRRERHGFQGPGWLSPLGERWRQVAGLRARCAGDSARATPSPSRQPALWNLNQNLITTTRLLGEAKMLKVRGLRTVLIKPHFRPRQGNKTRTRACRHPPCLHPGPRQAELMVTAQGGPEAEEPHHAHRPQAP